MNKFSGIFFTTLAIAVGMANVAMAQTDECISTQTKCSTVSYERGACYSAGGCIGNSDPAKKFTCRAACMEGVVASPAPVAVPTTPVAAPAPMPRPAQYPLTVRVLRNESFSDVFSLSVKDVKGADVKLDPFNFPDLPIRRGYQGIFSMIENGQEYAVTADFDVTAAGYHLYNIRQGEPGIEEIDISFIANNENSYMQLVLSGKGRQDFFKWRVRDSVGRVVRMLQRQTLYGPYFDLRPGESYVVSVFESHPEENGRDALEEEAFLTATKDGFDLVGKNTSTDIGGLGMDFAANGVGDILNVKKGTPVTFSWKTSGASSCSSSGGSSGWAAANRPTYGSAELRETRSGTYTLTCKSPSGSSIFRSVTVNVQEEPPSITGVSLSGGEANDIWRIGAKRRIAWEISDKNAPVGVYLYGYDELQKNRYLAKTIVDNKKISSNYVDWVMPSTIKPGSYSIGVVGYPKDKKKTFDNIGNEAFITVEEGQPSIIAFTINGMGADFSVQEGSFITLAWNSKGAVSCSSSEGTSNWAREGRKTSGSVKLKDAPSVSARYSITCVNRSGQTASRSFIVYVNETRPWISLISPNGGEAWAIGTKHRIAWNIGDIKAPVKLNIFQFEGFGGGYITAPIIRDAKTGGGYVDWTVPSTMKPGKYAIRAIAYPDDQTKTFEDSSDAPFSIVANKPLAPKPPIKIPNFSL